MKSKGIAKACAGILLITLKNVIMIMQAAKQFGYNFFIARVFLAGI